MARPPSVSLGARWILHEISLDENSFRSSYRGENVHCVADAGYGIALTREPWRFTFARYRRTRKLDTHRSYPVFGGFTAGRGL